MAFFLKLQTGDYLLLQTGDRLELQGAAPTPTPTPEPPARGVVMTGPYFGPPTKKKPRKKNGVTWIVSAEMNMVTGPVFVIGVSNARVQFGTAAARMGAGAITADGTDEREPDAEEMAMFSAMADGN